MPAAPFRIFLLLVCLLASGAGAAEPEAETLAFEVRGERCSAWWLRPEEARAALVLAHGAMMDARHPFMEGVARALARERVATLRFNFPYAEAKRANPDPQRVLAEALRAAAGLAEKRRGSLPLLVGGKSLGAMISAGAAGRGDLAGARGLVLLGFPLHAPGRPSAVNAPVLEGVKQPVLLVQGARDPLAELALVEGIVARMGTRAHLHVIPRAGHSYELPEGDSRTPEQIYDEIAGAVAEFVATLGASPGG